MRTLHIETTTHGRVLIEDAAVRASRGWIVGFHGYGQSAEDMLDELQRLNDDRGWSVAAPQGLHRFYTRGDQRVIASWMTRQDRELAIADNVEYVTRLLAQLELPAPHAAAACPLVVVGFSQGAAMAYRAAALGPRPADAVIALAGDIPPEVRALAQAMDRARLGRVLIGAGIDDTWFTAEKCRADAAWLEAAGVPYDVQTFAGGHEWTDEFRAAARSILRLSARAGE